MWVTTAMEARGGLLYQECSYTHVRSTPSYCAHMRAATHTHTYVCIYIYIYIYMNMFM